MSKKRCPAGMKLNLDGLKVQSFVTVLGNTEENEIKGGVQDDCSLVPCTLPLICHEY